LRRHQSERRWGLAGASTRRDRGADDRDAAQRAGATRCALRDRDDVHRLRAGARGRDRAALAAPARSGHAPEYGAAVQVAYFSMEFAVDDRLPIYAGGLGVLAGDHLKSSSDLQLPLVGVGLLYRQGYFTQVIDENGRQREEYPEAGLSGVGLVKE